MKRRSFLKGIGAGAAAATSALPDLAAAGGESAQRPNILLILSDDVGREVLGSYGGQSYLTPHLDSLAEDGLRFTHCYSCPVCFPSRVKIMTGRYEFRYPLKWGQWPSGERTFAQTLRSAGYATAVAGKWQLTLLKNNPDHAEELGFDESLLFGWHEGPRYHDPLVYENGNRRTLQGGYGPDAYSDFLIDFMKRQRGERPFFAYYSMALCHDVADDFSPPPPAGPGGEFRSYKSYRNRVHYMDDIIGKMMKALERMGLRRNTVVLYVADNGTPHSCITDVRDGTYIKRPVVSLWKGQYVRGGKGELTDAGTRVPFIANWPGTTPAGEVCDDLVDFSDFMPTLAELADTSPHEDRPIDGRSFAAQLRGKRGNARKWVFNQHGGNAWVRSQRWKLYRDGRLYDMREAPREKSPISEGTDSTEARDARRKLRAVFRDELEEF